MSGGCAWAVRVNESRLHSVGDGTGAAWWFWYRRNAEAGGRITIERSALIGDQVLVGCNDATHATWLAQYMHKRGMPTSAAQVVRA